MRGPCDEDRQKYEEDFLGGSLISCEGLEGGSNDVRVSKDESILKRSGSYHEKYKVCVSTEEFKNKILQYKNWDSLCPNCPICTVVFLFTSLAASTETVRLLDVTSSVLLC